jgi:hypothetical protein
MESDNLGSYFDFSFTTVRMFDAARLTFSAPGNSSRIGSFQNALHQVCGSGETAGCQRISGTLLS